MKNYIDNLSASSFSPTNWKLYPQVLLNTLENIDELAIEVAKKIKSIVKIG